MAREKDYLDTIAIVGCFLIIVPLLMCFIANILNAYPRDLNVQDSAFILGLVVNPGILMEVYVLYKRFREKIKK
jgi:hypothetical protein